VQIGNCTGLCSGGSGYIPEAFKITVAKACGGSNCSPATNMTTRSVTSCINSVPCPPRDCVGSWQASGTCDGLCGGGAGLLPEVYIVTTTAAYNGTDCPVAHGTTRQQTPCNNTTPCPVNCTGSFIMPDNTSCSGQCGGGAGFIPEVFLVTQPALWGGSNCAEVNGTMRYVSRPRHDSLIDAASAFSCTY